MKQWADDNASMFSTLTTFVLCYTQSRELKRQGGCPCSSIPRTLAPRDQAQDLKDETHSSNCITGREHAPTRLCLWGSCSLYSPNTLRQQKPRMMRMTKDLPGEMLGWSFPLPCQFVQLGLDALHKKAMEWCSPGAPDPQRVQGPTLKICKAFSFLG